MIEARWWKKLPEDWVECGLCWHACKVSDGERGTCGIRENRGGRYYALAYGRVVSIHVDPIEKKPFHHVLPGAQALSFALPGCNFDCKCCQNWEIAQARPEQLETQEVTPAQLVALARRNATPAIAMTYTEPVVWTEYVIDVAAAAREAGLMPLVISNGSWKKEPFDELAPLLGALKVDLKGFTEDFYKEHCRAELRPVLDTLRAAAKKKLWLEIVVLVIPGQNDRDADTAALAKFVRDEVGPDTPLHFTRFHPAYRLKNLPPTPVATIERMQGIAQAAGLRYVYVGNVPGHDGNNTYCPGCRKPLVRRSGMAVIENRLVQGRCPDCKREIPGRW